MTQSELDTRFHAVYLLQSLDPTCREHAYVGYTVNPRRRLGQHNGQTTGGAGATKRRGRPWEMLLCVHGFPNDRHALRFEYCWQHPTGVKDLRDSYNQAVSSTVRGQGRQLTRLRKCIIILHLLLTRSTFNTMPLTLYLMHAEAYDACCAALHQTCRLFPLLPVNEGSVPSSTPIGSQPGRLLTVQRGSMDALMQSIHEEACSDADAGWDSCGGYMTDDSRGGTAGPQPDDDRDGEQSLFPEEEKEEGDAPDRQPIGSQMSLRSSASSAVMATVRCCSLCGTGVPPRKGLRCVNTACLLFTHISCLAEYFHHAAAIADNQAAAASPASPQPVRLTAVIPTNEVECPLCEAALRWGVVVQQHKTAVKTFSRRRKEQEEAAFAVKRRLFHGEPASAKAGRKRPVEATQQQPEQESDVPQRRRREPVVRVASPDTRNAGSPAQQPVRDDDDDDDDDSWMNL